MTRLCYNIFGLASNDSEVNANMKADIHPEYGKSVVTCSCGETFETGSTKKEIKVEVCSKCHPPFYTGQRQTLSNTGGRVERFLTRYNMKDKN